MLFEKKSYNTPDIGGDFDSAPTALSPNAWVNAENVRVLTTDAGEVGNLESIGSTEFIPNPYLPAGENIEIGSATDEPNNRFVSFNWNSNGDHAIFAYYFDLQSWFKVLLNSQLTGGLNFDKNQVIHSTRIVNNCVYWVNWMQNLPRRINIEAGIKMNHPSFSTNLAAYTNPLSQAVVSWARRPPGYPPSIQKSFDSTVVVNNIANIAVAFYYYYQFRDYELSTLGFQSIISNYNQTTDVFNYIIVKMPFVETIDQDVIRVFLVARFLDTGEYGTVNIWDKSNPADAAAIAAHNSGTTQLTFNFYNSTGGDVLDAAFASKPFESIPRFSKAMDFAKNKAFLGNNVMGYTSPSVTSLQLSLVNPSTTSVTGRWFFFQFKNVSAGITTIKSVYLLDIVTLPVGYPNGYYVENSPVPHPPFPASIAWSDIQFAGGGLFDVMTHYFPVGTNSILQFTNQNNTSIISGAPVGPAILPSAVLKSAATYQAAITFYDQYQQKCGAVTNSTLIISIPDRSYTELQNATGIAWTLSNISAASEIMKGAYYYSVDLTLCLRTRFFLQAKATAQVAGDSVIGYVTKNADGTFNFLNTTYSSNQVGIAIDISCLTGFGQGYAFSIGDVIKLYLSNTTTIYSLSVVDQQAQYVIAQLASIGTLDISVGVLFEIYTPYKKQATEPFYEEGQVYSIIDPTSSNPTYSVTTGTFPGDVTVLQRTNSGTYYIESMSPNDKFYKNWFTNAGRANFIDRIGEQILVDLVSFSNTFAPGTQNNGLSTFDALDTKDVYPECGPISKLILTSKVESQPGTVMLGICEDETASLYLSETQMLSSDQNEFLAQATGVIGTVNVLKGSFGTSMPESVYEFRGNVFWLDLKNGKIVQYSSNGLFPISNYKATRFWKLFSEQFLSMTQQEIEYLGSRPFVFLCVDPHNWELLVTVPKLLQNPPKGYLPDYPRQSLLYTTQDFTDGAPGFTGMQVYSFIMPDNPPIPYGNPALTAYLQIGGSDGSIFVIQLFPNWTVYPASSAAQIIVNAIVAYMSSSGAIVGVDFNVFATVTTVGLYVGFGYNWPATTGDANFAPTTFVNLFLAPAFDESGKIKREIQYPFDIWDGQAKTLVYKLSAEPNFWQGAYRHTPEGMLSMRNSIFGFKFGSLFKYNSTFDYLINIFGVTYPARIMQVGSQDNRRPKVYNNISVEGNYRPSLTYFRTEPSFVDFEQYDLPEQASDLMDFDYEMKEGQLYCFLYRNKLQPTATGLNFDGLLTGEKMRAITLFVLMEFVPTAAPLELRHFTLGYDISRGHST